MSNNTTDDFLFCGKICLEKKKVPKLGSGSKILLELETLMRNNKVISTPLKGKALILNFTRFVLFFVGPDESLKFFEEIFPELVESNSVGKLTKSSFNLWESGNNEVTVELDNQPTHNLLGARDVYVGGPAALFSAAIQVSE